MRESLKILNVNSSGLRELASTLPEKTDPEIFDEAILISDLKDKEKYLRDALKTKPSSFIKSMGLLIELIKSTDKEYACELVLALAQYKPSNPKNYLLLASIALEHNALRVTRSLLDVSYWLCGEDNKDEQEQIIELNKQLQAKTKDDIEDVSDGDFWKNKSPDKYWILERIYYRSDIKKVADYCFRLLNEFSDDLKNYEVVYKVFSIDNKSTNKFIVYLKEDKRLKDEFKYLYLGLCSHNLLKIEESIDYLYKVIEKDIGNFQAWLYLALNYLYLNDLENFFKIFSKIRPKPDELNLALYFIYCSISNIKLDETEYPNQKNISIKTAEIIKRFFELGHKKNADLIIDNFNKLNYCKVLPDLIPCLVDILIRNNEIAKAKELLEGCDNIEAFRLYAWIYRIEGDESAAEEYLLKYRQNWVPSKDSGIYCKLIDLKFPDNPPDDLQEIFKLLNNAYEDTRELIEKLDSEYGLNTMTCVEAECQDCCIYTYPYITYVEYLYMKDWLDKQPEDFKNNIYETSKKVFKMYKEKYKKDPPFLNKENIEEHRIAYPRDFIFECPFLGNNKCNVYFNRPFTCRAYGFGSSEGALYKGCNYYFEQLKGATKLNSIRKVINMRSFFDFGGKIDKKLIGKRVAAPIPIWFAQNHDETLNRLKEA